MIKGLVLQYKNNLRAKQVSYLLFATVLGIPISIITSIIITKYLGVKMYGDYQFINNIFNLAIVIFTFGFFQAGNRALVTNTNTQKARELYGAELILTLGIFLIMTFFLVIYSFFDLNIHEKQLDKILLFIIPFGWVFLLTKYFEVLFQADNQIKLLGIVRVIPKIGFLSLALLLYLVFMQKDFNRLGLVLAFYLSTQIIVYIYVLFKLNISFKNFKLRLSEIWYHNKTYGFDVYLGSIFAVGFGQLSGVLISYFGENNNGVGFYSLAMTFTLPLSFIPNIIATTHYKDFSTTKFVPKKLILITVGITAITLLGLWIVVDPFVHIFYGKEFGSVVFINFILSIGVTANGFADFFNRFLGANGQGKYLRNSAFIVGGSLLFFNILLIPRLGATGAAFAQLISGFVYLGVILLFYMKHIRKKA